MKVANNTIKFIALLMVLLVGGMLARATIDLVTDYTISVNIKVWVIILLAFLLLYNAFMSFAKEK